MAKSGLPGLLLLLGVVTLCQGQLYHYKTVNGVIKLDKSQADHGIKAREIQTREYGKLVNPNFIPLKKRQDDIRDEQKRQAGYEDVITTRHRRSLPASESDSRKKRLVEVETRDAKDSQREARHELSDRMTLRDLKRFIKSVSHDHRDIHLYRKKK